jgi:hypothetical protein
VVPSLEEATNGVYIDNPERALTGVFKSVSLVHWDFTAMLEKSNEISTRKFFFIFNYCIS